MAAITGSIGLKPTLAAAKRGATVALANKETLVCAGSLFMQEVAAHGATLLPVDSEHNAIWQCFDFERVEGIEKITLTCSGGPFREKSIEEMREATLKQAVALAVRNVVQQSNKTLLISGASSSDLTGKACSPNLVHWSYDTYALSTGTARAVLAEGGTSCFTLTADSAIDCNDVRSSRRF